MMLKLLNRSQIIVIILLTFFVNQWTWGHESRPALASFNETSYGIYDVLWKVPAKDGSKLDISLEFPPQCKLAVTIPTLISNGAAIERYKLVCEVSGLKGKTLKISGLNSTITDVLLRIETYDEYLISAVIRPEKPYYKIPEQPSKFSVIISYGQLGFEHIIEGFDHLLFVLGLLLLAINFKTLIYTITSFTLAHSITLGFVILNIVPHPGQIIELIIAVSILFLAIEIVKTKQGKLTTTANKTVIFAFIIGLLHGFGFAGALSQIGLPTGEIPLALLFFNLGVEAGQLSFIGICLIINMAFGYFIKVPPNWITLLPNWGIGIVASYWVFERTYAIFV